jgi:hypothetical protein
MSSTDEGYRRERIGGQEQAGGRGWLDVQRQEDGSWLLAWNPDQGEPDYPGRSFPPGDPYLPDDFPGPTDPDALLAWGRERFAARPTS